MKTVNKALLVLVSSFVATASFAQVGLGVTNSTTVTKSVNAAATQGVIKSTTNAATKATTNAAANAAVSTKAATSATVNKAAEIKSTTTGAAQSAVNKSVETTTNVKNEVKNDANANARVNAQASVHASEEAKANANENSAVFGVKADGTTSTSTDVNVDAKPAIDKAEEKATKVKARAEKNLKRKEDYFTWLLQEQKEGCI